MKKTVLLILLFITALCQAQTKKIAYKSHSGSKHSFSKAYKNSLFDMDHSNFGGPGVSKMRVLDTLIILNDTTAIFKLRETNVCYRFGTSFKNLDQSDFKPRVDTLVSYKINYPENDDRMELIRSFRSGYYPSNPLEEIKIIDFREQK